MPRSARLVAAVLLAVLAVGGFATADTAWAQAPDDDCQKLDTGPVPNPIQAACDVGETVVDKGPGAVSDAVTAPVRAAGDEVMKGVTTWVGNGARWLVGQAGRLIDETTTPRIGSDWFARQYSAMAAIAAVFALPLLLLAVMQAVLGRDAGVLVRAACVNLPAAFLLTAAAVAIVQLLLVITDQASAQVAASVGNDAKEFLADTGKALGTVIAATGGNPAPLFAVFLGALIAAVGAFFVWIELLLRSAAIYVCVLFLPLTFVAMIWPSTARWAKRLVEALFAIIVSKFVIVAIMALAAAGLGQSRGEDAFQGVLAGAALMVLAAFSPFVLLRLIPLAETAVESSARWRGGAGSQALGQVASPGMVMRRVLDNNWGGGSGGGLRAAPAGASSGAGGTAGAGAAAGGVATAGATAASGMGRAVRGRMENLGGAAERPNARGGTGSGRPTPADTGSPSSGGSSARRGDGTTGASGGAPASGDNSGHSRPAAGDGRSSGPSGRPAGTPERPHDAGRSGVRQRNERGEERG